MANRQATKGKGRRKPRSSWDDAQETAMDSLGRLIGARIALEVGTPGVAYERVLAAEDHQRRLINYQEDQRQGAQG